MMAVGFPPVTREAAQAAARRELDKAIYHRYDDPWPVRVFHAVAHWLDRALSGIAGHAPGGGPGAVGLVVLVIALLAIARWRLGPMQQRRRVAPPVLPEQPSTAADHRRAAEHAAGYEDWRTAVVERMRAVAREAEEAALVDPRPGRTAAELVREVAAARAELAESVGEAARVFDAVAYGGRTADAGGYATVSAADDALRRQPAMRR